jgi:RNA polymerase sigma factor (TIGR02999 family)
MDPSRFGVHAEQDQTTSPDVARTTVSASRTAVGATSMNEVSHLVLAAEHGDQTAAERLLPLVYEELRRLAARELARERPGHTLQPTALVHEAYVRLVDVENAERWNSRGHFFAAAAQAMRRILVESARRKKRQKRGGELARVELVDALAQSADERYVALDEAMSQLAEEDPVAARVVELHHFAGLGHEQVASVLQITVYRARQKWAYSRAWLSHALDAEE